MECLVGDALNMSFSIGYPGLFVIISESELEGVMGVYVDEIFNEATPLIQHLIAKQLGRFNSNPRVIDEFDIFSSTVFLKYTGEFLLSQSRYDGKHLFRIKRIADRHPSVYTVRYFVGFIIPIPTYLV